MAVLGCLINVILLENLRITYILVYGTVCSMIGLSYCDSHLKLLQWGGEVAGRGGFMCFIIVIAGLKRLISCFWWWFGANEIYLEQDIVYSSQYRLLQLTSSLRPLLENQFISQATGNLRRINKFWNLHSDAWRFWSKYLLNVVCRVVAHNS